MANIKVFTNDELKALVKMDFPLAIQRADIFPLDPSTLFTSKADADLYAAGGADSRGLGGTVYAGQIVTVVENDKVTVYTVEANGTLKALGGETATSLADLTAKVEAILNDTTGELDSFADVKAKFDSLPKDMVVSGGEVRVPTAEEKANDDSLVLTDLYIILSIANSDDKLYIPAKSLVDIYTAGTYTTVEGHVVDVNMTKVEEKLVTDSFAKKADITAITDNLATKGELNTVNQSVTNNTENITNLINVIGDDNSGIKKDITDIKAELEKKLDNTTTGSDINVGGEGEHKDSTIAASVEDLYTKVDDASKSGVISFAGKVGAITIDETGSGSYKVALSVSDDKKLSASISGLGTAAAKNVEDFDATGSADAVKTALIGASNDASTANTIAAAKKYADEKAEAAAAGVSVTAEGDTYVSASGSGKKVTVTATDALKNAVTKANSAVQSVVESEENGKISVDGEDVAVHGLGTAAYTNSNAYATASQGTKADSAIQSVSAAKGDKYVSATTNGTDVTISSNGIDSAISTATAAVKVSVTNGGYITGTVDTTGREITLGSTVQAVSDSSDTKKGLAEASDVKSYVDSTINNYQPTVLT